MKRREISAQDWLILKKRNCDRDKHRMRTNKFGVTWCVICGKLGTVGFADELKDGDGLVIKMDL